MSGILGRKERETNTGILRLWTGRIGLLVQEIVAIWLVQRVAAVQLGLYKVPDRGHRLPSWLLVVIWMLLAAAVVAPIGIWFKRCWAYFLELPVVVATLLIVFAIAHVGERQDTSQQLLQEIGFLIIVIWIMKAVAKAGFAMRGAARQAAQTETAGLKPGRPKRGAEAPRSIEP